MKTVQQIYSDYNISPNLQLHQLKVAGVAKIICENFTDEIDKESVILACLFHDMGNIIKFNFKYFPESREPEGIEYWQKIKDEYISKYGPDEHIATESIAREINLPEKVIAYINKIGFSYANENELNDLFEDKICNYSDMRVAPYGVTSLVERILEGKERYKGRKYSIAHDSFETILQSSNNVEKQIFNKTNIKPEDITDEKVKEIIDEFRNLIV